MLPTIWPGDFLMAGKLRAQNVHRGDVVVAHCPSITERVCLKRVVGVAGDRVEFRGGMLHLNGQPALYRSLGDSEFKTEEIEGNSWGVWPEGQVADMEAVIVPPEQLFVLNDRRSDLDDSRTWGPLPRKSVDAKAIRVWASLDWFDGTQVRSWPRLRWERMLRSID